MNSKQKTLGLRLNANLLNFLKTKAKLTEVRKACEIAAGERLRIAGAVKPLRLCSRAGRWNPNRVRMRENKEPAVLLNEFMVKKARLIGLIAGQRYRIGVGCQADRVHRRSG